MALSVHTAIELSKLSFVEEINLLKKEIDTLRPLSKETEQKILQKFRLDWNYHSNAIEGNQLTYGETVAFIMEGVTAKGKTLKDHLDIKGHDEAVKYLLDLVKNNEYEINEAEIRNLHATILKEPYQVDAKTLDGLSVKKTIQLGKYKSSPNHVETATGEIHYYASVEDTPARMHDLMTWYKEAKQLTEIHPIVLATLFHHEFTSIHPFDDGNGRMGRLLMNMMLLQSGYTPVVVKQNDRTAYYQVLRQADAGEMIPITEYMSKLLKHSLNVYIKGANGESIDDEDDIDKEIALFRKLMISKNSKYESERKQNANLKFLIENIVLPFTDKLKFFIDKIQDLFEQSREIHQIEVEKEEYFPERINFNNLKDLKYSISFYTNEELQTVSSISFSFLALKLKNYMHQINSGISITISFSDLEWVVKDERSSQQIFFSYNSITINQSLKDFEKKVVDSVLNDLKQKTDN